MVNYFYQGDLFDGFDLGNIVVIDCEIMGLNFYCDCFCVVQLLGGDGNVYLV